MGKYPGQWLSNKNLITSKQLKICSVTKQRRGVGTGLSSLSATRRRCGGGRRVESRRGVGRPCRRWRVGDGGTLSEPWGQRQVGDNVVLADEPRTRRRIGDDGTLSATTARSCTVESENYVVLWLSTRRQRQRTSVSVVAVAVQLRRHCVDSTTFTTTFPTCP